MAVPAISFEVEYPMETDARLARLEERTEHVQRDVTEIKGDLRRMDSKIDALGARLESRTDALGARLESRTDALGTRLDSKIDALIQRVGDLAEEFGAMQMRMMMWSLGTTIAVASLAFGIAKWIK